jgi:hypothetical protein
MGMAGENKETLITVAKVVLGQALGDPEYSVRQSARWVRRIPFEDVLRNLDKLQELGWRVTQGGA